MIDIDGLIEQVAAKGPDQSQAKKGGELPAAGQTRLRLVEVIELGKHPGEYKGVKKENNKIRLTFELSGKNHPPRQTDDGPKPVLIGTTLNLSQSDNSQYFALFSRIRGEAKHISQLLGHRAAFLGEVVHEKKGEQTYANIKLDSIRPAYIEQMDSEGEITKVPVPVDAALTPCKLFVWDFATPEMWDSIYIDGEWEEKKDDAGNVTKKAQSKNKWQEIIRSALNFEKLPCYDYAKGSVTKEVAQAADEAVGEPSKIPEGVRDEVDPEDPMAGIS